MFTGHISVVFGKFFFLQNCLPSCTKIQQYYIKGQGKSLPLTAVDVDSGIK